MFAVVSACCFLWALGISGLCMAASRSGGGPELRVSLSGSSSAKYSAPNSAVNTILVSGLYSPYHTLLIKSQVSGRIVKMNVDEGDLVPPGHVYWRIDCETLKSQAGQIRADLSLLVQDNKVLSQIISLRRKSLVRYETLYRRRRVSEQALDNVRLEYLSSRRALLANEEQQHQLSQNLIQLEDQIKKSEPKFAHTYYVSRLFHEKNEYVTVGEPVARLLDLSHARVRLVLAPSAFLRLRKWMTYCHKHLGDSISYYIRLEHGNWIQIHPHLERFKLDPADGYLYSYSVDLVFPPVHGWLWGQVVKVRLVFHP